MSPHADTKKELSSSSEIRLWLAANNPKQFSLLQQFEVELRLGRLTTSSTAPSRFATASNVEDQDRRIVTTRTVELLRSLIGSTRWRTGAQLLMLLRGLGEEFHAAGGFREPAIGNVVRRIMCAVREEVMASNETEKEPRRVSLLNVVWSDPPPTTETKSRNRESDDTRKSDPFASFTDKYDSLPPQFHESRPELRSGVMEVIQEIVSDLEDLHKNINEQATNHIHAGEIILTYGRSKTIELFLKAAASKGLKFQVIVCEGAPHFGGHAMAKSLSSSPNIETIVIHDAATFALMARVNKVLLPAHAVLANGGLITTSGSHLVALAAKQNAVPVVAITGMFKLCPVYPHDADTLNDLVSPASILGYEEMPEGVELINTVHDYIPPQLISLYVTNVGGFQPSYIYRLLAEYYHQDDWLPFE